MSAISLPATGVATTVTLAAALPENVNAVIVPVFCAEDELVLAASDLFDNQTETAIFEMLTKLGATGKAEELTRVPAPADLSADFVLAVGLGNAEELNDDLLRRASAVAVKALAGVETAVTTLAPFGLRAVVEGSILGSYHYTGFKSETGKNPVHNVVVLSEVEDAKQHFDTAEITAQAVNLARDLVNIPSSHLYPESYAEIIKSLSTELGIHCEIFDENQLRDRGFGGILAVGSGSARKPRLVTLTYTPENPAATVALVGKGVTFDTGGISIKPASNMDHMISDMGGSAAAVATIIAAARLKLNVAVTVVVGLAENMPDGESFRPGDVVTHYGGKTTEVLNTDAEGRLILADALVWAGETNPDYLIDIATLTGAQLVALGERTSGVMGNGKLAKKLAKAGRKVGENAWEMPLPDELTEAIKSPIADLRNLSPSRWGGMLSAGCFLKEFVNEETSWAHIDIAGPSFNTGSAYGYTPARGTGVPVRTLVRFLHKICSN